MRKVYSRLPKVAIGKRQKLRRLVGAILSPCYWSVSHLLGVPGLDMHRKIACLGAELALRSKPRFKDWYELIFSPLDSVRYFEFDFMWKSVSERKESIARYLDLSSPRMFSAILLSTVNNIAADIVNPDARDLKSTFELLDVLGLSDRCRFHEKRVEELEFMPETLDMIACMSVIEHIPGEGDHGALKKQWDWLRRGGTLMLSVPCAREAYEEFIDINEYRILTPEDDGFVFGQRFYDSGLLERRVFQVTGEPVRMAIYGEKAEGSFFKNRHEKLSNPNYPFWREPYMMGEEYRFFSSIGDLPGLGVVAMEFVKT